MGTIKEIAQQSNNFKPRISCSLPDVNSNLQILLCAKCKSTIPPNSAYVLRSNSIKTSSLCLPCDWIRPANSDLSTLRAYVSMTSDSLSLTADRPESGEFIETSATSVQESSDASWRALADPKYPLSDSETSSFLHSSNNQFSLVSELHLPRIKKIESVYFNIMHIDPVESNPYKFLMSNDNVKFNSNNNLTKRSQVFYMPLKLYGIRDDVEKSEESTWPAANSGSSPQQPAHCNAQCSAHSSANTHVRHNPTVAPELSQNSIFSVSPRGTLAKSIPIIAADLSSRSRSSSKTSAKRMVHPHIASQSPIFRKEGNKGLVRNKAEIKWK